jgi:ERF superfamily
VLDRDVAERETKQGGILIYTTLTMAYTFYAPDGSNVRAVVVGEAMDTGDKSSNKAMSAALKYALLQIFCVPTEIEDADAQSHELKSKVSRLEATKTDDSPSPTLFWLLQREYGVPKELAQAIVAEHGQNWKIAVDKLKALIPEVSKGVN